MPEGGLTATEVGKEIAEHQRHDGDHADEPTGRDRWITIVEAALLAVVALLAAWSGYASAKWATESRLDLSRASAARTKASAAQLQSDETLNFDASTFSDWFAAELAGNQQGATVAERRFRPEFHVAWLAWMATDPFHNTNAPPGPTFMPEYKQPDLDRANQLDATADALYDQGSVDGTRSDDYVRTTVYLATVLFLVGISGHFALRSARLGLISVAVLIVVFAVFELITLPKPHL
ncbi:MAG TPA: hypothetical protein VMU14_14040 [Acidimicrobiales bacterium]|nr:hypothetical protein [Acidimicrobiales bacterium]